VKWEEYNPKAKEALGKTFIDIGAEEELKNHS